MQTAKASRKQSSLSGKESAQVLEWIAGWLPRHFIGAILVSLPALAVYSHVTSEFE